MPEYKRKKVHTKRRKTVKPVIQKSAINIPMRRNLKEKTGASDNSVIRVVRGKKGERKKKLYILASCVLSLVLILVIMSIALPVSLFESMQNLVLSMGGGTFPLDLSGTAVVDCVPNDNYYYVLTDTNVMAFTNGGKRIFSYVHGFSSPIISTSQTRAIVFDQGKNTAIIYNLSGIVDTIQCKDEIIAADIAKNGEYALVTNSDSYASTVSVYNRKGKSLYSINLAKDMVNNIDIASSGKKIAISTINGQSGKVQSSIRIYDFESADPVFNLDLGEDTVYDIENSGRGFFVTTHNKMRYVRWSKPVVNEFDFDGEVSVIRHSNSGFLTVYNKTNDKSNNSVVLFANSGKKTSEFDIKSAIGDIRYSRGRVYTVGNNQISIFDKHGKLLRSDTCNFGAIKMAVVGSNAVCTINDNQIQKSIVKKG